MIGNRPRLFLLFFKFTRIPGDSNTGSHSYILSRWLFLRLLGIIYFIAFLSFWIQIPGLIGSNGILPTGDFLDTVKGRLGTKGYWIVPTLAWFNAHDWFLESLAAGGAFFSVLLIFGVLTAPVLGLLWIFYLSLVSVGQVFTSFQWDTLLLETGFLAIFLAPFQVLPRLSRQSPPSSVILWLFRFLLFRLMFSSGFRKLLSGDPTWRNFTALDFHYYTQPLPTPIAWYMYQLPEWFHKLSVGLVLFIELVIPFFIFAPRRPRFMASAGIIFLQILIELTGNYTFFNLLSIALCLLLFDDAFLQKLLPRKIREAVEIKQLPTSKSRYKQMAMGVLAAIIILLGGLQLAEATIKYQNLPGIFQKALIWIYPLRVVNNYGLFEVMTTSRPEIIIEGSNDGQNWTEYEFKYKPGDIKKPPQWVAPYQPRLDWQMWFAALGSYQDNTWFINLIVRLLQGSPEVIGLLGKNPFPSRPPKYIRALVYEYSFTNLRTRGDTGDWWQRELKGLYFPPVALNQD